MKRILPLVLATLIVVLSLKAINEVQTDQAKLHLKEIKIQNINQELDSLQADYKQLELDKSKTEKEKQDKIKQLQDKQKELEKQLQAKRLLEAQEAKAYAESVNVAPVAQKSVTEPVNGCNTGNPYKDYIYMKESSCNPSAINSIGCRGIGQACPGTKLPCGADFTCQDAWFSRYAVERYGSWEAAYNHWLVAHWW